MKMECMMITYSMIETLILWLIIPEQMQGAALLEQFSIQMGGIYHHLCKDNSITNIIMAVILFYMVKEWKFHSKVINKVAGCMFAVFALNNSLVKCMMEVLNKNTCSSGI